MEIKKYKVVCSQPKFSDEIYIDIAPDHGIIHDQILFSRIILHRQISNEPLSRLYGSIYLTDNNGDISVEFPKPQSRKGTPIYEGLMRQYSFFFLQIVESYRKMRQAGSESTLLVCSIDQMFELSERKNAEADAFERKRREKMRMIEEKTQKHDDYKQKHAHQLWPQTPQEEERMKMEEQLSASQRRRIAGEQKRATETLPARKRFQKDREDLYQKEVYPVFLKMYLCQAAFRYLQMRNYMTSQMMLKNR